ncbi:MAG: 16S rRNA (cytosine(1402)-N(4))-methyltransferase RsmH [Hyphomicrobiaceae bacterium]|nr:16S rRNA (cytosine(1402)-N(4))-methyltransferase RsmH [Hyphomicrobiaceae bacterium]
MTRPKSSRAASGATERDSRRHIPVLLSEVIESLAPKDGDLIIDGTFGAGGYTSAILDAADCRVLALDRDPRAVRDGAALVERYEGRLTLVEAPFSEMADIAAETFGAGLSQPGGPLVDAVVLDIGVSSMQLDEAERGFSFQNDGPLDMRMSAQGESAADFLNTADEEDIANVIYVYGEERRSRAIARAIVRERAQKPFSRTLELADTVLRVFHGRKVDGRHPATRTFQALRIYVNDELGELARALSAAESILKPEGRLAVVTFHSLEDRIVKKFFASRTGKEIGVSRHLPVQSIKSELPSFRFLNSRPLTPSKGELDLNPRARSARLRWAIRTGEPTHALDLAALEVPSPAG